MKYPKIYVDFEIPNNPRDFLRKLFIKDKYNIDVLNCIKTYADKELKIVQCEKNKQRSFDELFFCTKTYFEDITPKEILHILLTLRFYDEERKITYFPYFKNCVSIRKINMVYYCKNINFSIIFADNYRKFNSLWFWKELFAELNINNLKEMEDYIYMNLEK